MMDYMTLKDRLLAATTALVIAGTCLAYSVRPAAACASSEMRRRSIAACFVRASCGCLCCWRFLMGCLVLRMGAASCDELSCLRHGLRMSRRRQV